MAYNVLAGMTPEIWSGMLLRKLDEVLVFGNVVNRDYEGEIRSFGDTVKINEIGDITINDYESTSTGGLTVQSLSDAQKLLKIDQAKSFSFWVDDVDAAQMKPKVMDEAMSRAAFGFRKNIDSYIAARYTDATQVAGGSRSGSTITGVDITSTNTLKYLSIAQQKLDEQDVPEGERWMVVPPWFEQKMILAKIIHDTSNSAVLTNGVLGRNIYGFTIYKSNNVTNGTPAADDACIMFGYRGTISLAVQLTKVKTVEPSMHFKTLVKGLLVYGAKVVRPNTLGVLYANYTDEAT